MNKAKILLDIAVLGAAYDHQAGARGIHRVGQHTFESLLASSECELGFVATSNLAAAYDFLANRDDSLVSSMKYEERNLLLDRKAQRILRWVRNGMADRRLHKRIVRALAFQYGAYAISRESPLSAHLLEGWDIYHSLLGAIPESVLAHPKIKHFVTIYDLIPFTMPESVGGKGAEAMGKIIDPLGGKKSHAFCISEHVRNELLEHNNRLLPEQVFVTPLAASRDVFFPVRDSDALAAVQKTYGIPPDPYFLTLSSFDPRKNFQLVIDCFGKLMASGELNGCNLLIVGSNPERNTFVHDAIAQYPRLKDRIITPGYIPDRDLAAIYSGARAFLFPSLAEGFGIPLLEAMQCGIPVISSNTSAMPEVMGDAGLLLDPRDKDAWAQAMIKIFRDSELRETLREKGLERAQNFTWKRFSEATLKGYSHALGA